MLKSSYCLTPAESGQSAPPPSKAVPYLGKLFGMAKAQLIVLGTPTDITPNAGSTSKSHDRKQHCRYRKSTTNLRPLPPGTHQTHPVFSTFTASKGFK